MNQPTYFRQTEHFPNGVQREIEYCGHPGFLADTIKAAVGERGKSVWWDWINQKAWWWKRALLSLVAFLLSRISS